MRDIDDEISAVVEARDVDGLLDLLERPEVRSSGKLTHAMQFRAKRYLTDADLVPVLARLLVAAEDLPTRFGAASELGNLRVPGVVDALRPGLRDEDARVRGRVIESMTSVDPTAVVEDFVGSLGDPGWAVRVMACKGLGVAGEEASVKHLVPLLKDEHKHVRSAAMNALAEIGGAAAESALLTASGEAGFVNRRLLRSAAQQAASRGRAAG